MAAGSCVCNEANLTGEALPVQKRQCPVEDVGYEVEGRSARHTLFSSTLVLQAGSKDSEEVVAVVSATGTPLISAHISLCDCLSRNFNLCIHVKEGLVAPAHHVIKLPPCKALKHTRAC